MHIDKNNSYENLFINIGHLKMQKKWQSIITIVHSLDWLSGAYKHDGTVFL